MVVFPNCKINIGLRILDKRPDGFHNLETIFYPIPLKDSLEIIRDTSPQQEIIFSQSGNQIDGVPADNLCIKAYRLLKKDFPQLPAIQMHLHKAIPLGAGLGGGSADAAFAIKLLNEKFQLNLSPNQLISYSLQLGSDCPFFIINKPCYATGRGEIMQPLTISLSGYQLVLINPGIQVNTGWAFSQLKNRAAINSGTGSLHESIYQPIQNWRNTIGNDFEIPVFEAHPSLQKIKEELYLQGALYAAMSGSGSTIYGLFNKKDNPQINMPAGYFVKNLLL